MQGIKFGICFVYNNSKLASIECYSYFWNHGNVFLSGGQIFKFCIVLFSQGLVDCIAFHEIVFQNFIGPYTKLGALLIFHAIAYGDNCIQRIEGNRLFHSINTQKMRVVLFLQFIFGKDIVDAFSDGLLILLYVFLF